MIDLGPNLASRVAFDPNVSAVSHVILGSSEKRVALTFFAPDTGQATLSNDTPVVNGSGIVLKPGQAPLCLWLKYQGDTVQREWYVIYAGLASAISWIETFG